MKELTASNFRPYGKLIEYPGLARKGTQRNLWRIVHTESAKVGWRIAYLVLRDKSVGRLESHPFSDETLEPARGRALLAVALTKELSSIRWFQLDKPVVLRKGVWHALLCPAAEAEIKITENSKVTCRYWPLGFRIQSPDDLARRLC